MLLLGPYVVILFLWCDVNLALYLCPNILGRLTQLVGTELIRHGTLGGTIFTAPKQIGVLPETQVSYSNKSLIPEAIFDYSYEVRWIMIFRKTLWLWSNLPAGLY